MRKRKTNNELQTMKEYLRKFHALWPMVETIGTRCPDDGYYTLLGDFRRIDAHVFYIELLDAKGNLIWSSKGYEIGKVSGRQALCRSLQSFRKELRKFARREEA